MGSTAGSTGGPTASPVARRLAAPGWLDGRLVLGVLLVLVSVVAGARVLAGADDATPVWALSRDLAAGSTVTAGDLERQQVRLADGGEGRYVIAPDGSPPPTGYVLARGVGAGELLPRAALRDPADGPGLRDVAVPVEAGHLPGDLRAGQRVDVWLTLPDGAGTELVLPAVPVRARPGDDRRGTGGEAVVLSVDSAGAQALVRAVRTGTVDLVRVPGGDLPALDGSAAR